MSGEELHPEVPLLLRRLANRLGKPFGINPFPRAFEYGLASAEGSSQSFDAIYEKNHWGSEESRSGVGSELHKTARYRQQLEQLIREQRWRHIFDAPCGDLRWMPEVIEHTGIRYSGGDISAALIANLKQQHPSYDLRVFDICRDAFPEADVWHCRDCLFHLPFADIRAALVGFVASKIPYALLTTHRARLLHRNLDLRGVGFRYLDLMRPPLALPPPLAVLEDFFPGVDFPRYVGLWTREMIHQALAAMGERP